MARGVRRIVSSLSLLGLAVSGLGCEATPARVGAASLGILGGVEDPDDSAVLGLLSRHQDDIGTYYTLCTGSLIAPTLVLTARHCVADNPDGIACGSTRFGATDPPDIHHVTPDHDGPAAQSPAFAFQQGHWFGVEAVIPSEGTRVCGNDIALLRLDAAVPSELATPIDPRIGQPPEVGERYRAVGFGARTTEDDGLGVRRQLEDQQVGCVGNCPSYLDTDAEWEGGNGTCIGDSGGPALDPQGRVIGVSSRSDPDCTGSIYTSVHAWGDWLAAHAIEAAAAGGYPVPAWVDGTSADAGVGRGDGGALDRDGGATDPGPDAGDEPEETSEDEADRSGSACGIAPPRSDASVWLAFALLVAWALHRKGAST